MAILGLSALVGQVIVASAPQKPQQVERSMASNEPSVHFPVSAADRAAAAVALDTDFDTRWAAWATRGRIHEQRVRRTIVMWAGVIAVGTAIVYAFVR